MGKVYTVNGKKYTFDEVSYTAGKEQIFKVNGVQVRLHVEKGDGDARFMGLKMPGTPLNKANELLPAVYAIMDQRIKNGDARKLEQAAMLQLHYNEASRAEDMARGLSGDRMTVYSVVNKNDLSQSKESVKLNMDLTKKFPWLKDNDSREKKKLKSLEEYRKLEYFPDGSAHDTLAWQRYNFEEQMKALQNLGNSNEKGSNANLFVRMLSEVRA